MNTLRNNFLLIALFSVSMLTHAGFKPGESAAPFTLKSLDGPAVSLKELTSKGHVMLIFWETECVYCFMHISDFNALHEKYKDKGLTIAAINFLGEHEAAVKEYVENNHLKYLMLTDRLKNIDVANDYKVIGSPTIVVIAPNQKILFYGHKVPQIGNWIK
jgi:peroxiredoxin